MPSMASAASCRGGSGPLPRVRKMRSNCVSSGASADERADQLLQWGLQRRKRAGHRGIHPRMKIIPTIMSGGAGARLWPVSRETHPKPFIKLADGKSLLQHAFLRAAALPDVEHIVTITNRELFFKTEDEYRELNASGVDCTYLLEPMGRDTAAATAVAALYVQQVHGDDAIIVLFPSDHMIRDLDAFRAAAVKAIDLAMKGRLVTFGINPQYPETGYGYIEADGEDVVRFVEKPDLARAKDYIASGRFYWNSGMFCFSAGTMVRLMEQHCPDILDQCRKSVLGAHQSPVASGTQVDLDPDLFLQVRRTPSILRCSKKPTTSPWWAAVSAGATSAPGMRSPTSPILTRRATGSMAIRFLLERRIASFRAATGLSVLLASTIW